MPPLLLFGLWGFRLRPVGCEICRRDNLGAPLFTDPYHCHDSRCSRYRYRRVAHLALGGVDAQGEVALLDVG